MIETRCLSRAALLLSAALVTAPLAAQDAAPAAAPAPQQVSPPAVVPTVQAEAAPAAPASTTAPVRGADPQSSTPVNAEAAAQADAEAAERRAQARPARTRPSAARATPRVARAAAVAAAPTAAAAAPVAAPAPAPATAVSAPAAPAAAQGAPTQDAAPVAPTPATEQTNGNTLYYVLGALALAVLALGAVALLRRRRADDERAYEEPVYAEETYGEAAPVAQEAAMPAPLREIRAEPVAETPVAAPVAAAPLAAASVAPATPEDASVSHADAADVDALTAAAPAAERPWLELAMRPVRAGADGDQARVDVELTVGNAGSVAAEDVRIATFMLPAGSATDMERLIAEHAHDAEAVAPLTIQPGDGTRVDATLALPGDSVGEGRFQPVVVADARYRLPDGSEGRTSASFIVGVASDGELGSLDAHGLREDVEARLYADPVRA